MSERSVMEGLSHWRLADELSVVDASFLTLNLDPGDFEFEHPNKPAASRIFQIGNFTDEQARALWNGDVEKVELHPSQFRAVFKALRTAILSNKLKARIVKRGRQPLEEHFGDRWYDTGKTVGEDEIQYGFMISWGKPTTYSNSEELHNIKGVSEENRKIYALVEPDWQDTTLELEELRRWYRLRGFAPTFYFPQGGADGFRNIANSRYSAKLATAVAAWEAVKCPYDNKSAKQSLAAWIVSNGVRYELGNEEGIVSPTVAYEVAKIANWQTSGGATPTAQADSSDHTEDLEAGSIENFEEVEDPDAIPF